MAQIILDHVVKAYPGRVKAVDDLSLDGRQGGVEARVSKERRVRHGSPLELLVDTRYLQFFDPDSGLSIGHPKASAAVA